MPAALHVHSWFSLLEGAASPEALVRRAAETGYSALALTDTNNLHGVAPFVAEATRAGIRPLVGAHVRHLGRRATLLAADAAGYRSLCRVLTEVCSRRAGGVSLPSDAPLLDALLRTEAAGLHVLTDDVPLAEAVREAFPGRLWLEVVRPGSREAEVRAAAGRLGLRLVASTAAHLLDEEDYEAHRLVTAIRRNTLLGRVRGTAVRPGHRLLGAGEMKRLFADLPEAIANGEELASVLRSDVLPRRLVVPEPRTQHRLDLTRYLRALCERGLRERGLGDDLKARARLRRELAIIEENGLPGYFLTVRDIARLARKGGHTMALRGSAGNSLVCYLLGITDVDPLRFGLELERFLHPGRVDLPDIDLDFNWKVRDEVIDRVIRRHGVEHAARICMHLRFQPRSAFREAGKAHGLSSEQVSELLTSLEERVDALVTPEAGAAAPPCPRLFPLEPQRWPRLLADARRLLGRPMHPALHPGGIVITPGPLRNHAPLQWAAKGVLMTQYDKDDVEAVGLVKIDLLGNRALSTVDEAVRGLAAPVPHAVDCHDDPATVRLLRRGDTVGITQLESPAMRHLLVPMRPRGLDDVIQALALIRPGAASAGMKDLFLRRRRGAEEAPSIHPLLESVLGETHGVMLYEDDSLRALQALTGMDAAEADRFRKRIARHRTPGEAEELRREFLARAVPRAGPAELDALWEQMVKFNRYSFCKSHAVSYGLIAWRAAWLKAHHPVAFWAAALNNAQGSYPPRVYVEAAKRAGITIQPPCVNRSALGFSVEGSALRVGLESVSGVPEEARQSLLAGRPYASLSDLRSRAAVGPEALSALIRVGAFDFTGKSRPELYLEAELGLPVVGELFTLDPSAGWTPPEGPPGQRWHDEWRLLGFVLGPPLYALFRPRLPGAGPPLVASRDLRRHAGRMVRVAGLVATGRLTHTEAGRPLQFVTLEDEQGLCEVTLFDGTCNPVPHLTIGPYVATGVVEDRFGAITLTAHRFERAL